MFSAHLLLLQNEEPKCTVVCSSDVQSRVHVEAELSGSSTATASPIRVRLSYPVTIQCSAEIVGRPGGSIKNTFGHVVCGSSIEVHAGAVRPQGTCSIVAVSQVVAATVDVTVVCTSDVTSDVSEPYGFILGRSNVLAVPYAIHNATLLSEGIVGFGAYATVIHISDPFDVQASGSVEFVAEVLLPGQVRMDGIARFRAIGTYYVDSSVNLWGKGDAIFQGLLNFGGLLPSGSVRKTYLVDDSKVKFVNPSSVGLALGAHSRYLPVSLVIIDDLIAMGPSRFPFIEEDPSDVVTTVNTGEDYRLDILSMRAYGTAHLWWVIAAANGIRNPFTEPEVGTRLRLPALDRIYREIVGRVA